MHVPPFTLGVEEEYLLVDPKTRALIAEPPRAMLSRCETLLPGQVSPEFLRSQIEVQTRPHRRARELRADLVHLRRTIAAVAAEFSLAPVAAATHPLAVWSDQLATQRDRYQALERDLQAVSRRLVICGLHVHVGIEDDELTIDLMNQVAYFLPHLLALSTSSPFWRGEDTGLKSYRVAVFNELPRTGLPDHFESHGEYQRQLKRLVTAGLIEDATKLWWDVRPSARFPTLEMRLTDIPTRLDDTVAIAALYQCILSMLWRLRVENQRWRLYPRMLVGENRWRAQRHGIDAGLVDFGKGEIIAFPQLLDELIALTAPDAQRLDCVAEIASTREILVRGTSAHRQIAIHRAALAKGAAPTEALGQVVDWLIAETISAL